MVNNFFHDLNKTNAYEFKSPFAAIDGIYTLSLVLSFSEMLNMGIDLFANLYEPLGISNDTYDTDWPTYVDGSVLKLDLANDLLDEDRTEDLTSYYIPESILAKVPDPNITKVYDIYLSINLGLFTNPDEISFIKNELDDKAATVSGTTDDTRIISAGERWVTKTEYDAIKTERDSRISTVETLTSIIKRQTLENASLKVKIAALEQAYLNLST